MYVVTLSYVVDLAEIDSARDDHMAYLATGYEAGVFLASGARIPRVGGVILARASSREELDDWLARDPFHERGLAEYEVVEFAVGSVADGLEGLRD